MVKIIGVIIFGIITITCFIISYLQFKQKGFLFNNTYIYATNEERKTINKKPYYIQSSIAFLMVGIIFLIITLELIIKTGWLFNLATLFAIIAIFYAIISTVFIEKNKK